MNEESIKKLLEKISNKNYIFENIKFGQKGFMVFSEETYSKKEAEKLNLNNYTYKRRYYYTEEINNNFDKKIIFILFNCSTSSPDEPDSTIDNCRYLAREKYKYSQIEVLNLFSIRNSNIKNIEEQDLEDDEDNLDFIFQLLEQRKENCDIVCAWGYGKEKKYTKNARKQKNKIIYERIKKIKDKIKSLKEKGYNIKKISPNKKKYAQMAFHPGVQSWNSLRFNFKRDAIINDYIF